MVNTIEYGESEKRAASSTVRHVNTSFNSGIISLDTLDCHATAPLMLLMMPDDVICCYFERYATAASYAAPRPLRLIRVA